MAFLVDFDQNLDLVALCSPDSLIRVWEATTTKLVHEYLPSAHLSTTCTCLKWRSKNESAAPKSKKKKSGSKTPSTTEDEHSIIAFGTTAGTVNIYDVTKGKLQCVMDKMHTSAVTSVCWSPDGLTLYSSSDDGLIVQWDLKTATASQKWMAKSSVTSLYLCGRNKLIAAGRSISVWDLDTLSEECVITGHSTDIQFLHAVQFSDGREDAGDDKFIISVAHGDRVVSVWSPTSGGGKSSKKCKRARASFILQDEPVWTSVSHSQESRCVQLAVVTAAGSVEVFEHQLNGSRVSKPLRARCCLRFSSADSSGKRLPVLAAVSPTSSKNSTASRQLLVMYGTEMMPTFETIDLNLYSDTETTLTRQDPSSSVSITKVTSVGNIRQPVVNHDSVTTLAPASSEVAKRAGSKKSRGVSEKRPVEEQEMTIEERLALLQATSSSATKTSEPTGPVDSLSTLLAQGLQSNDKSILHKTLETSDAKVISTTVRRLPASCIIPLLRHLTERLEQHSSSTTHMALVKWVRALLQIHASHLATFPELVDRLQGMYSTMENRAGQLSRFTRLQGRLELMLSQVARQNDDEQGAQASTAALLTLQDESSEDEMMDDLDDLGAAAHYESEDGYLSADEEDLVK